MTVSLHELVQDKDRHTKSRLKSFFHLLSYVRCLLYPSPGGVAFGSLGAHQCVYLLAYIQCIRVHDAVVAIA